MKSSNRDGRSNSRDKNKRFRGNDKDPRTYYSGRNQNEREEEHKLTKSDHKNDIYNRDAEQPMSELDLLIEELIPYPTQAESFRLLNKIHSTFFPGSASSSTIQTPTISRPDPLNLTSIQIQKISRFLFHNFIINNVIKNIEFNNLKIAFAECVEILLKQLSIRCEKKTFDSYQYKTTNIIQDQLYRISYLIHHIGSMSEYSHFVFSIDNTKYLTDYMINLIQIFKAEKQKNKNLRLLLKNGQPLVSLPEFICKSIDGVISLILKSLRTEFPVKNLDTALITINTLLNELASLDDIKSVKIKSALAPLYHFVQFDALPENALNANSLKTILNKFLAIVDDPSDSCTLINFTASFAWKKQLNTTISADGINRSLGKLLPLLSRSKIPLVSKLLFRLATLLEKLDDSCLIEANIINQLLEVQASNNFYSNEMISIGSSLAILLASNKIKGIISIDKINKFPKPTGNIDLHKHYQADKIIENMIKEKFANFNLTDNLEPFNQLYACLIQRETLSFKTLSKLTELLKVNQKKFLFHTNNIEMINESKASYSQFVKLAFTFFINIQNQGIHWNHTKIMTVLNYRIGIMASLLFNLGYLAEHSSCPVSTTQYFLDILVKLIQESGQPNIINNYNKPYLLQHIIPLVLIGTKNLVKSDPKGNAQKLDMLIKHIYTLSEKMAALDSILPKNLMINCIALSHLAKILPKNGIHTPFIEKLFFEKFDIQNIEPSQFSCFIFHATDLCNHLNLMIDAKIISTFLEKLTSDHVKPEAVPMIIAWISFPKIKGQINTSFIKKLLAVEQTDPKISRAILDSVKGLKLNSLSEPIDVEIINNLDTQLTKHEATVAAQTSNTESQDFTFDESVFGEEECISDEYLLNLLNFSFVDPDDMEEELPSVQKPIIKPSSKIPEPKPKELISNHSQTTPIKKEIDFSNNFDSFLNALGLKSEFNHSSVVKSDLPATVQNHPTIPKQLKLFTDNKKDDTQEARTGNLHTLSRN